MEHAVEIYQLAPDCQVCGQEVSLGDEKQFKELRVCKTCKGALEASMREKRKQARAAGSVRRR